MRSFQHIKIDGLFELIDDQIVTEIQDITWTNSNNQSTPTSSESSSRWNPENQPQQISPSREVVNAFAARSRNSQHVSTPSSTPSNATIDQPRHNSPPRNTSLQEESSEDTIIQINEERSPEDMYFNKNGPQDSNNITQTSSLETSDDIPPSQVSPNIRIIHGLPQLTDSENQHRRNIRTSKIRQLAFSLFKQHSPP
jgi:hypothetical protein